MFPHMDEILDIFPHADDIHTAVSRHLETACLLSNRKPDTKVRINVDLEDYDHIKDAKKMKSESC